MSIRAPAPREVVMAVHGEPPAETYRPWSVVTLVFHHLADQGLHPTLGDGADPGEAAAALLRALGIEPATEGSGQVTAAMKLLRERTRGAGTPQPE